MESQLTAESKNELGQGILLPDLERQLIASGVVFACTVPRKNPKNKPFIVVCHQPIDGALAGMFEDAIKTRRIALQTSRLPS